MKLFKQWNPHIKLNIVVLPIFSCSWHAGRGCQPECWLDSPVFSFQFALEACDLRENGWARRQSHYNPSYPGPSGPLSPLHHLIWERQLAVLIALLTPDQLRSSLSLLSRVSCVSHVVCLMMKDRARPVVTPDRSRHCNHQLFLLCQYYL